MGASHFLHKQDVFADVQVPRSHDRNAVARAIIVSNDSDSCMSICATSAHASLCNQCWKTEVSVMNSTQAKTYRAIRFRAVM